MLIRSHCNFQNKYWFQLYLLEREMFFLTSSSFSSRNLYLRLPTVRKQSISAYAICRQIWRRHEMQSFSVCVSNGLCNGTAKILYIMLCPSACVNDLLVKKHIATLSDFVLMFLYSKILKTPRGNNHNIWRLVMKGDVTATMIGWIWTHVHWILRRRRFLWHLECCGDLAWPGVTGRWGLNLKNKRETRYNLTITIMILLTLNNPPKSLCRLPISWGHISQEFLSHRLAEPASVWISNYIHVKKWHTITHLSPNFIGGLVKSPFDVN